MLILTTILCSAFSKDGYVYETKPSKNDRVIRR